MGKRSMLPIKRTSPGLKPSRQRSRLTARSSCSPLKSSKQKSQSQVDRTDRIWKRRNLKRLQLIPIVAEPAAGEDKYQTLKNRTESHSVQGKSWSSTYRQKNEPQAEGEKPFTSK